MYKKLIVLLLIIVVGIILFIYPKSFKQTYKDVKVYENGEEYFLHPYDLYMFPNEDGNFTDNGIYMCSLYNEKIELLEDRKVTLYITHDKSTLYIIMDNQEFIYPYNTDEDYQKVRERGL